MKRMIDEALHVIYEEWITMGQAVQVAVSNSMQAFIMRDKEKIPEIIKRDLIINSSETIIEKKCFKLIVQQQPASSDLRRIVAMMKSTSDLERIGDHAVSIAQSLENLSDQERLVSVEKQLQDMAQVVQEMLDRVLGAYVDIDVESAKVIAHLDEKVDDYLTKVHQTVVSKLTQKQEATQSGLAYVLVAGYLERMGDYITNICERIVYMETGKIVELN